MMSSTPRAIKHYRRWTKERFRSANLYFIAIAAVLLTSFITWWFVAEQVGEKFDWITWAKLSSLFSVGSSLYVFIVRWAAVGGSWIIAKQARDLIRSGDRRRAWLLLCARYRGVHPLVINDPSFREILADAAIASDDPQAGEFTSDIKNGYARQDRSVDESDPVTSKSRKAAILIFACLVIIVVGGLIRLLLA